MDKDNQQVSERHKRRLAKEKTDNDLLIIESCCDNDIYSGPSAKSTKLEMKNTNTNSKLPSTSSNMSSNFSNFQTSPSHSNDEKHYSLNFHGNTDSEEVLSDQHKNLPIVATDDDDFVDFEDQDGLQQFSDDSDDDSSYDQNDVGDEDIDNDEEEDEVIGLFHTLRNWIFEFKIKNNAVNALLGILRQVPNSKLSKLPMDARTLLKTPKKTDKIVALSGGLYYHFGLSGTLELLLQYYKNISLKVTKINVIINIDGLPLSRSSPNSFWPILVSDDISNQVHLVGLFYGQKKPNNANEFLQQFVEELIPLVQRGFYSNIFHLNIKIHVKAMVCDAPAKSFILNIKGHNGYSNCTKCTIYGEYINFKMCFPYEKRSMRALRTDDDFVRQTDSDYHQVERTILLSVPNLGLVSNIALDYMHLICLGVVKKLISLWMMNGPLAVRIRAQAKDSTVPKEFSRRPRSLNEIPYWKATEFRQFLL